MRQDVRGGPHQQIVDGEANPGDGKALRPARIAILAVALRRGLQQLFDVGDGFGFGEARFVQINLEAVFDGAHQLDAVEGAEIQVRFEICPRRRSRGAASRGDARDQFRKDARATTGPSAFGSLRGLCSGGAQGALRGVANHAGARLARRSPRKIGFGPHQPPADSLVFSE